MFAPSMTDFDIHLWSSSKHYRSYQKLGAHLSQREGQTGVHFGVWAPNARYVSVVGDFNGWRRHLTPMQRSSETGIWTAFVPGIQTGTAYKYYLQHASGYETERCDPYGFWAEQRPRTASRVWDLSQYQWKDQEWMARRPDYKVRQAPLNVYEVHLGSWMRMGGNRFMSYHEMAERLVDYVDSMGYTHVELLPITEHPYDGSWGYQTLGYFAPTSRFGNPDEFRYLVDTFHQRGIGVILDWVPAHFPRDGHGLSYFDGTHLYEHADPRQGAHPDWGTLIFNYGRHEVKNFLISSALFWLDEYHLDGLRVDAVASMLYLDYGRKAGEWVPNHHGGRENLAAVEFLREFNQAVQQHCPGCFTMAEESTAWPGVTAPVDKNGLGFTLKWNMGWMHDTLKYLKQDPIHRKWHHHQLTFGMLYQYTEEFMLPLSHDEVVHLKKSLLSKQAGDEWQMRAHLRTLLGYMIGHPGKKLLFMGGEFGQWNEWNDGTGLDWHLMAHESHRGLARWSQEINGLYKAEGALWQQDNHPDGFQWIECNDADTSVYSFLRYPEGQGEALLFVCNFTPVPRPNHRLGLPWKAGWEMVLNSDDPRFGGSGVGLSQTLEPEETPCSGRPFSAPVTVPPLSVLVFRSTRPEETAPSTETTPSAETAPEATPMVRASLVAASDIAL